MNLWIFKVHCKNYKGVPKDTIHMCHGVCRQSPGTFVPSNTGSLAGSEGRHGVDWPKPARGVTGGEGGGAWEIHQTLAHL